VEHHFDFAQSISNVVAAPAARNNLHFVGVVPRLTDEIFEKYCCRSYDAAAGESVG